MEGENRPMIELKACTRCGGDMMVEEILGDADLVCLQCGHRRAMPQADPVWRVTTARRTAAQRSARVPQKRAA
jgi:DNA-directed RNA polymerase subunit RPC12/RpoP